MKRDHLKDIPQFVCDGPQCLHGVPWIFATASHL